MTPLRLDVLGAFVARSWSRGWFEKVFTVVGVVVWFADPTMRRIAIEAEDRNDAQG